MLCILMNERVLCTPFAVEIICLLLRIGLVEADCWVVGVLADAMLIKVVNIDDVILEITRKTCTLKSDT